MSENPNENLQIDENKKADDLEKEVHRKEMVVEAKRLLNIFRQFHVLEGGIKAVNEIIVKTKDDVVEVIKEFPSGLKLAQHINNLKEGKTGMGNIEKYLLPLGPDFLGEDANDVVVDTSNDDKKAPKAKGVEIEEPKEEVKDQEPSKEVKTEPTVAVAPAPEKPVETTKEEVKAEAEAEVKEAPAVPEVSAPAPKAPASGNIIDDVLKLINEFKATPEDLENLKNEAVIKAMGDGWITKIEEMIKSSDIQDKDNVLEKINLVSTFNKAVDVWNEVSFIIANPKSTTNETLTEKMPSYKEYLFMFGDEGKNMYNKVEGLLKS